MKAKDIINQGIPSGKPLEEAIKTIRRLRMKKGIVRKILKDVSNNPKDYKDDPDWNNVAKAIIKLESEKIKFRPRESIAPYKVWGENIEPDATTQLLNACMLPISVRGALMPDAHLGYGLPIGGVLATENCVIPYAVGVDIACRMHLSVYDADPGMINTKRAKLTKVLQKETRFGIGCHYEECKSHPVMDDDWEFCTFVKKLKDVAWEQLGTSGGGNHFIEFGIFTEKDNIPRLALLSHSGSRGTGGKIAKHYSDIAMNKHIGLPGHLKHLAWLPLDSHEGQEYWQAMELMGKYAAANHEIIHNTITRKLNLRTILEVENHHNFAWKEVHDGKEVVVHRKGATPAGEGIFGVIPGSMGTPGYLVKGKGVAESLNSASHGAGRRMSRKKAKETFTKKDMELFLEKNQVTLLSGGLDECPQAYKDIKEVMAHQSDLVEIHGEFLPRLVMMAADEKPKWKK